MRVCSVEGCGRERAAKGLCMKHYNRQRYTGGSTTPYSKMSAAAKKEKKKTLYAITAASLVKGREVLDDHYMTILIRNGLRIKNPSQELVDAYRDNVATKRALIKLRKLTKSARYKEWSQDIKLSRIRKENKKLAFIEKQEGWARSRAEKERTRLLPKEPIYKHEWSKSVDRESKEYGRMYYRNVVKGGKPESDNGWREGRTPEQKSQYKLEAKRRMRKKNSEQLTDRYIRHNYFRQIGVKNPPQELIELKRVQLKIYRALKNEYS
jgi:hypothetical protein